MHALLVLFSLGLVVAAGYLALALARRHPGWGMRRDLQLLALATPVVSLGIAISGLQHFLGRTCFLGAPPWDYLLGLALTLGMAGVALGALGLAGVRPAALAIVVNARAVPAQASVVHEAHQLARRLGTPLPRVLITSDRRPFALAAGLVRPTLLLSRWMLDHLDRGELHSVLAHELCHVARRDYLVMLVATALRDAFFYLPSSRAAHRLLAREKELACDDLAVAVTKRPLALASALAKVWERGGAPSAAVSAPAFAAPTLPVEARIERLLTPQSGSSVERERPFVALATVALAGVSLILLEVGALALFLAPMGCGPASALGRIV